MNIKQFDSYDIKKVKNRRTQRNIKEQSSQATEKKIWNGLDACLTMIHRNESAGLEGLPKKKKNNDTLLFDKEFALGLVLQQLYVDFIQLEADVIECENSV